MADSTESLPLSKASVIRYLQACVELAVDDGSVDAPDGLASRCDDKGAMLFLTFGRHDFTVMVMDHTVRDGE